MNAADRPAPRSLLPGSNCSIAPRTTLIRIGCLPAAVQMPKRGFSRPPSTTRARPGDPSAGRSIAAYGLFWFDPVTHVGLVEPMRTEEDWQHRGLARSILTTGIDRLAKRGATRMKVGWGSPPGRALYLSSGFGNEVPDHVLRKNTRAAIPSAPT